MLGDLHENSYRRSLVLSHSVTLLTLPRKDSSCGDAIVKSDFTRGDWDAMQRGWFTNRIVWALVGVLVFGIIGAGIAGRLGAYHFSDAATSAGSTAPTSSNGSVDVTGTITTIDIFADTFGLQATSGATVTVKVTQTTQFGGGAAALGDFNPGQRVEVTGAETSGVIQAATVTAK